VKAVKGGGRNVGLAREKSTLREKANVLKKKNNKGRVSGSVRLLELEEG